MSDKPKINRLIWDIETSPCLATVWQPGWRIRVPPENIIQESAIICICYKWEGSKKVESLEWDKGDDKELCERFIDIANQADELIAHNGDKFDLPKFKARCIFHDLDPTPIYKTVDTLVIARRRFKFNSNRLDYLGKYLFGEGKIHTEYGMWRDILIDNCPKAMAKMVKYCKQDVNLLEKVWKKLEPYHAPKTHVGRLNGEDKWTCPYTGSAEVHSRGRVITAAGNVKFRMRNKETGQWYQISEKAYRDYLDSKDK
jgi:predicted PolB exonuclease-like 3'-5' exonuclease